MSNTNPLWLNADYVHFHSIRRRGEPYRIDMSMFVSLFDLDNPFLFVVTAEVLLFSYPVKSHINVYSLTVFRCFQLFVNKASFIALNQNAILSGFSFQMIICVYVNCLVSTKSDSSVLLTIVFSQKIEEVVMHSPLHINNRIGIQHRVFKIR